MKKIYILLFLLFFALGLSAQIKVIGQVKDTEEISLVSSSVMLTNPQDSSLVSFGLTNDNGDFIMFDIPSGKYRLQVTYLGYQEHVQEIELDGESNEYDVGLITLSQSATTMDQVVIEGEHTPIMVKKDTLVYNADAFKTQPNDVVEDLLRRLPGVEVESDGSIKAQGEDVQKVLVDGKKFFGDDPKMATRNLPADAVDKVEIYDKKSDMAEFSGVDDGEREKTINLELKEDKKKGAFGNATAGYGTVDRYTGKLSYNRFSKKTQVSFLGNINNVNEQGFSVNDYISFMGGMGSMMGGGFRFGGGGVPISDGLSNGFVETKAGGVNFNYDISDKTDLSVSYFVNDIQNKVAQTIDRENFLEGQTYLTYDYGEQLNTSINHRVSFELESDIDSTQSLKLNGNLNSNNGDLTSYANSIIFDFNNDIENELVRDYTSIGDQSRNSASALYRKKFGGYEKSTLTLRASLNTTENYSDAYLDSDSEFFPDDPVKAYSDFVMQQQLQNDDQSNYLIETAFVRPLQGTKYIEFKYNRRNFDDDISRDVYDDLNGDLILNDTLSSHYTRDFIYDRFITALHLNGEKSSLTLEGGIQNSQLNGDIISEDVIIQKNNVRFLPRMNWRYELGQSHNIRLRYSTSVREPSLTQLQPITNNSDPQNIYIGNPDLVPEYRHQLRLNYVNYDQFSFRSFFAYLSASYTKNNITNKTTKEVGTQIRQSVNVDYNFNLSGTLSFSSPIRPLGIKTNIRTRLGYSNGPIFLNDIETIRDAYSGNINLRFENRKKDVIDWLIGGSWGYNISTYDSAERTPGQKLFNRSLYADFSYNLKESLLIRTGIDVDFYPGEGFTEDEVVPIWTASISKYILNDQRGELKLSVFDILDKNIGIERNNTLNYIENSSAISLSRYFMFSFTYNIRKAGSKDQPKVMISRR